MDEWGNASKVVFDMSKLTGKAIALSESPEDSLDQDSLNETIESKVEKAKRKKAETSFIARLSQFGVGAAAKRM